ncbi:MAG: hypothetical protein WCT28_03930 [Patescibacteria group bacterium]|jgi:hypothetical protein
MSLSFDRFERAQDETRLESESRTWKQKGEEIASRQIASAEEAHPSFADIFWHEKKGRLAERIAILRARIEGAGLQESEAAQLRAAEIFVEHIKRETEKYQNRDQMIDEALLEFGRLFPSFPAEDHAACTELIYLLKRFLIERHRSLQDIGSALENKINSWLLSRESREAVVMNIHRFFGEEDVEFSRPIPSVVRASPSPASFVLADSGHSALEAGSQFRQLEDPVESIPSDTEEESPSLENAAPMDRSRIEAIFVLANIAANSFIERPGLNLQESLEDAKMTIENEKASMSQGIEEGLIGARLANNFFESYLFAFEHTGNDPSAFNNSVRIIIDSRCRILALEKAIAEAPNRVRDALGVSAVEEAEVLHTERLVDDLGAESHQEETMDLRRVRKPVAPVVSEVDAHEENRLKIHLDVLGVSHGATADEIEKAYIEKLKDLDAESHREDLRRLNHARLALFHEISLRERKRQAEAEKERNIALAELDAKAEAEKEGVFSRMLRSPGRLVRAAVGSLALLIAGGAPTSEFSHAESEQTSAMREVGPQEEEGSAGAKPVQQEVEKEIHPLEAGDSVWKVVVGMLRDRGLSTSATNVQYFTHQALVDNGLDALSATNLKVDFPLDLTDIKHEMDSRSGRVVLADAVPMVSEKESVEKVVAPSTKASVEGIYAPHLASGSPYAELPTMASSEHVMQKGEHIYKMVHNMLRSRGLNWTTERINFLTQVVVDQNVDRFRALVAEGKMKKMDETQVPFGAKLDFSNAIKILDDMEQARKEGKKAKTVRQLAGEQGYPYPFMMKFPKK